MKSFMIAASAIASTLVLSMGSAISAEEKTQRLNDAWASALIGDEPVLSAKQTAKLNNLAFQAAATRVCEGFELSQDKFIAALEDATASDKTDLSDDAIAMRQSFILVDFGMRYGLLLAEGEAQDESFCKNAAELKTKADIPNVWE
jgi:hypothetical protein